MSSPRRRTVAIIAATAVALGATAATGAVAASVFAAPVVSTIDAVEFDRPLIIPPIAPSTVTEDGERVVELTAQSGTTEFRNGVATPTAGFSQNYLGPTILAARHDDLAVEISNGLAEPTTVHWHGMHLPAAMDGGPHSLIDAGDSFRAAWTIDQPAATLWYHPHPHGATTQQVRQGMAGLVILTDEEEAALPLPRDYGVDDIPVVVADVRFNDQGEFLHDDASFVGALGDELLVNGTLGPYQEVTSELVRLRLVNASSARVYEFALEDQRPVKLIASDGGLLAAPVETTSVVLSPGERAEIVVTFEPGETVRLQSIAPDLGNVGLSFGSIGARDQFDVLELRAAATLTQGTSVPSVLSDLAPASAPFDAVTRSFVLDNTEINGLAMDMNRIDATVELGSQEVWAVTNVMTLPHNFHIHGPQFRVLSIDGEAPPAALAGLKDTVYLEPGRRYRLLVSFEDYADPTTPYMFHCHLLSHEDDGMMGQFVVVEPGQPTDASPTSAPEVTVPFQEAHHDH